MIRLRTILDGLFTLLIATAPAVGVMPCTASAERIREIISPNLSWDEYRSTHVHHIGSERVYRVEVDILLNEDELYQYFLSHQVDGGISTITSPLVVNVDGTSDDLRPLPTDIGYCYVNGWGANQGTYTAPGLANVRQNLELGMRAWQGVANVRFRERINLSGTNNCNTAGTQPATLDFVVTHYDDGGTGIATGPFPSRPWAQQQLQIPVSGITVDLAVHELGHALGFRHEHVHANGPTSGTFCTEAGNSRDLTTYDPLSAMAYQNCGTSQIIVGSMPTQLDGIGARSVYGPPDWWWAILRF